MTDEEKENDPTMRMLNRVRDMAWTRMQNLSVHNPQYTYWGGVYAVYDLVEQIKDQDKERETETVTNAS